MVSKIFTIQIMVKTTALIVGLYLLLRIIKVVKIPTLEEIWLKYDFAETILNIQANFVRLS
jgi:hypothetical protein